MQLARHLQLMGRRLWLCCQRYIQPPSAFPEHDFPSGSAVAASNVTRLCSQSGRAFSPALDHALHCVAWGLFRLPTMPDASHGRLMVVHEIGVRTRIRYTVNRIDEEYFDWEDL